MEATKKPDGYDPIALTATTEKVVIRGNKRKYANLARNLRFYGGTTSATEINSPKPSDGLNVFIAR